MSFEWLDLILVGIMLLSGVLAMMRGFTREALSLVSWAGAALAAYFAIKQPQLIQLVKPYVDKEQFAQIIVGAICFIFVLIFLSLISIRISDAIVDSAVGSVDRTIGLVFGFLRGYLLVVIAFLFYGWLLPADKQESWIRNAVSLPVIKSGGSVLLGFMPDNIAETLSSTALVEEVAREQEKGSLQNDNAQPPTGYPSTDAQGMNNLVEGTNSSPTPAPQPRTGQGN